MVSDEINKIIFHLILIYFYIIIVKAKWHCFLGCFVNFTIVVTEIKCTFHDSIIHFLSHLQRLTFIMLVKIIYSA